MFLATTMSYRATNKQAIDGAFKTFGLQLDSYVKSGMVAAAVAGLEYLVEAHQIMEYSQGIDGHPEFHIHEQNTMAYAVSYNGNVVTAASYQGDGNGVPGVAIEQASAIVSGTTGWVAIIYSEMDGWYKLEKEQDYQRYSRMQIIQHFHDYFKPVNR